MKLTHRVDYSDSKSRARLAKYLSLVIEGADSNELPYKPNKDDDYFWTLDLANDWKVKFIEDAPSQFEIIYRYQCLANQYEEVLAAWLKIRIGAEKV